MPGDYVPKRVEEYFVERLRSEVSGERGAKARLSRALGISDAHMSNVVNGKAGLGIDVMHKLARHWGQSYAELEMLALGGQWAGAPPKSDPAGLAAFLAEYPSADATIVALLRAEAFALKGAELDAAYFRETYEEVHRALVTTRRLALKGEYGAATAAAPTPSEAGLSETVRAKVAAAAAREAPPAPARTAKKAR